MTRLNLDTPVGQWVAEHPNTSRVFEAFHIDYCCGGGKPLADACAGSHVDPQQVLAQLQQLTAEETEEGTEKWTEAPLAVLCDNIEQTHHAYLKTELPRLRAIIDRVFTVHGANHPELADVRQAFASLEAELVPHMFKEERILFPAIRYLEASDAPPAFPFGTVANPIRMMEHEHDHAGGELERIRRVTGDYRVPEGACNTYRAMLDGLDRLERDMHLHVHKENNILFPRAIALEESLAGVQ